MRYLNPYADIPVESPPLRRLTVADDVVHGGAWRTLDEAAQAARDQWARAGDDLAAEDAAVCLAILCVTVRQAAAGQAMILKPLSASPHVPRLLDAMTRSFVGAVDEAGDSLEAAEVVRVMCALHRVRTELERDPAHRFTSRLSGPEAQDMLVEVAHDMRSPLGAILFLAERIKSGQSGAVSPVQARQMGLIYNAAFGLSSLASDLLELARGGDKLIDHTPIPFSVDAVMEAVHDIVRPIAEEKRLELSFEAPPLDYRVGHATALTRVLLNLTTNALKFTSAGSVRVSCRELSGTTIRCEVSDTGRGIPAHVLPTLFDSFRQKPRSGDSTFSSAGLGLSICQKLVRGMGGELTLETELEKGTRFCFELDLPVMAQPPRA